MKVGVVGLGRMGGAMAERLLQTGHDVAVYDLDAAKRDALAAAGARPAASLAELCGDREVVITMLAGDAALDAVTLQAGGLVASLPAGAIHMACGTHGVHVIGRLVPVHHQAGQTLVAVPVLGRPDRAAAGKLGLVPGGSPKAVVRLQPLFAALGETVFQAGPDPLQAAAVKVAHNFVLGCAIEAMGEGSALVRKYGVDPELFHDVLTKGIFNSVAYQVYGDIIAKDDWDRLGVTAQIGLKDANLALAAAEPVGVPLPSCNVWRDRLLAACQKGDANRDWSVMALEQFRASGLE